MPPMLLKTGRARSIWKPRIWIESSRITCAAPGRITRIDRCGVNRFRVERTSMLDHRRVAGRESVHRFSQNHQQYESRHRGQEGNDEEICPADPGNDESRD